MYQVEGHQYVHSTVVPSCWTSLLCTKLMDINMFTILLCTRLLDQLCTNLMDISMFTVLLSTRLLGQLNLYQVDGHQYGHSNVVYQIVGPGNYVPS